MSEQMYKTLPANLEAHVEYNKYNWLGVDVFEPVQVNAGGTPGAKNLRPFSRIMDSRFEGTRYESLSNGYVKGDQKTRVYHLEGLFENIDYNGHRGGIEYHGYMNKKGYYYYFSAQAYNSTTTLYPGALAGFSCHITVGNNVAQSTGMCKHNWGDHTHLNKVIGLWYNLNTDKYFTEVMKSVGSDPYPLRNQSETNTGSQFNYGPLRNGETKKCHFVQTRHNDSFMAKTRFCGFAFHCAVSNNADSSRCHIYQVNRVSPIPVGYQNMKHDERQVLLERESVDKAHTELRPHLFR